MRAVQLSDGVQIRPRRRPAAGLLVVATIAGGLVVGAAAASGSIFFLATTVLIVAEAVITGYRPALGLALFAFILPLDLHLSGGPIVVSVAVLLLIALLGVCLVGTVLRSGETWRRTPLDAPVLVFAAASCLSLLGMGGHLTDQIQGLLLALAGVALFFVVTQFVRTASDTLLIIGATLVAALLQAGKTTIAVIGGNQPVSEWSRATGPLSDPNHFAGFLVLAIPLLVAVGIAARSRWSLPWTALAALILVVALFATLSRSGWLGLIAGMVVLGASLREQRWRTGALVAIITAVLLAGGASGPIGARLGPHPLGPWEMLASRTEVWRAALSMAGHHPLFGVGIGNFINYFPTYVGYPWALPHAHNLFLNLFAERGIVGLASFAILMVTLFLLLVQAFHRAATPVDRALAAGLAAAFCAYLVHSVFDVSYVQEPVLLLFWLLLGLAASQCRLHPLPGGTEESQGLVVTATGARA